MGKVFVAMVVNCHGTYQQNISRLVCPGLRRSGSRAACLVVDSAASLSQDDRPSDFLQALFRPRVCFAKFMSHYLVWFNTIFSFSCILTKPCRPNFDFSEDDGPFCGISSRGFPAVVSRVLSLSQRLPPRLMLLSMTDDKWC